MTIVTLELPQQVYKKAERIAKATRRPIEQVVLEWIHPPAESQDAVHEKVLAGMEKLSTAQLTKIVRSVTSPKETERLRTLLDVQEQRGLTATEYDEAARLVGQEDLLTLRKAKAIYLLKQRNALPKELAALGA